MRETSSDGVMYRMVVKRCRTRPGRVRLKVVRRIGDGTVTDLAPSKYVAVQRADGSVDRSLTPEEAERLSPLAERALRSGEWSWGGGEGFFVRL